MKFSLPPFVLLFITLGLFSCRRESPATDKRPNIIFILADDHAAQAIGAYGSRINRTPNIDRLAAGGMRFDRVFCTNSICAPSRAVILTGRFSHLNGVPDNRIAFDGSQETFPKLLQKGGYETAVIGKWHLRSDPTGFDYWNVLPGQGAYYNPTFIEMGEPGEHEGYVTDLTTDFALRWLDGLDGQRPFFLLLGNKAPHRNWMPGPQHLTLYDGEDLPEPATLFDDYRGRSAAAREQEMRIAADLQLDYDLKVAGAAGSDSTNWLHDWTNKQLQRMTGPQREAWTSAYEEKNEAFLAAGLQGDELIRWKYQRYVKDYLRSVASVDDNIGRLLDYLEEKGLAEHTLVIYSSDQGFFLGEHGWFDKRFMYEESYRMPFIVRYPAAVRAGASSDALCMNVDFAPTLLDFAGVEVPAGMQGRSLRGLMEGDATPAGWRSATYYHYYEYPGEHRVKRHYGVRTSRYKLIHFYYDIDAWELYDLEKDPFELNSVYDDPAYAAVRDSLAAVLRELQQGYGDDPAVFTRNLEAQESRHVALGAPLSFLRQPAGPFRDHAASMLTDGSYRVYDIYAPIRQADWVGFREQPMEVVVDLGSPAAFDEVAVNFYQSPDALVYYPETINCFLSDDGKMFRQAGGTTIMDNDFLEGTALFRIGLPAGTRARYVKVLAMPMEYIPSGQPGGGSPPWLFVDEIMLNAN